MAVRTILHYPDPRLRQKARVVEAVTPEIKQLVDDMAETMYAAPGVGLAATQIGEAVRVFVIDTAGDDEPSNLRVFINPEIVAKNGELVWEEGCLSFPGVMEEIERAAHVKVKALDAQGQPFELEAEGLLAVAIQHENDHLDGTLMIDKMGALKKRIVDRKMRRRAAERPGASAR
jgi:peptide deformylase